MPYSCLADFLELLEQNDELLRVDPPVDPEDPLRDLAIGSKAVLLSSVKGRRFPMVGRLMTDPARICRAIGVADLDEAAQRVEKLVRQATFDRDSTRIVKQAASQQVVRLASDLEPSIFPGLRLAQTWTTEQLTAATLFTIDPDSGKRLGAAVEWMIDTPTRLVPCWTHQDRLGEVRARYGERERPMPVAISFGGDPSVHLAAEAPTPCPIDPCILGATLRDRPIEVVPCRMLDGLTIPADADLVIEGLFVNDAVEVQAVTHRINPIVPFAMPNERTIVRRTLLQAMLPWWRAEIPGLTDLVLPEWGGEDAVLVGSVEKAYTQNLPEDYQKSGFQTGSKSVQQIATTLADHPVWSNVRLVILLDETVDLSSESEILTALVQHADFGRKTLFAIKK